MTARWAVEGLCGVIAGLFLACAALGATALVPISLPPPSSNRLALPAPDAGVAVQISMVTTGTGETPCPLLAQGLAPVACRVEYRAALIHHPRGTVLFGTGAAVAPRFPVVSLLPAPELHPGALAEALAATTVTRVLLPTPRWQHTGGVDEPALSGLAVEIGAGDRWYTQDGPWPYRLGIVEAALHHLGPRLQGIRWTRSPMAGFGAHHDVFGDGTVVAVSLRGSTSDEIGLLVSFSGGRRALLVGDAVWRHEQVDRRRPRPAWSTWVLDRNRMQLSYTIRTLQRLQRELGVAVVPLLDADVAVARYPGRYP